MEDARKILIDMFEAYKHTSGHKDELMMEIMCNREKYEKNLNEMWALVPKVGVSQMIEYSKGVKQIKDAGLKVLRNPAGKHKIVYK